MTKQARIERATSEQPITATTSAPLTAPQTATDRVPVATGLDAQSGAKAAIDRSSAGSGRGSIVLVLLVAALLVAAATGIVLVGVGEFLRAVAGGLGLSLSISGRTKTA